MAPTPEDATATLAEYRDAHPDYRGRVNGKRAVLKLTTSGTCLVAIEEDREGGDR